MKTVTDDRSIQKHHILTNHESATYINVASSTLRNSRHTGFLLGIRAPRHIKIGTNIRYLRKDLDEWLTSLEDYAVRAEEI